MPTLLDRTPRTSSARALSGRYCTSRAIPDQNPATASPDGGVEVESLILRMHDGDREAAAEFISRYGDRLRRRIRNKISATPSMRAVFDSQDILSTVGRRLDLYVLKGQLQATSLSQLMSLMEKMVDHAVIDKVRVFHRLRRVEVEDGAFAQQLLQRLRRADDDETYGVEIEIQKVLRLFRDKVDRTILSHWLDDRPHSETAAIVGLAPAAVRKRWQKIRARLQERFAQGRE